MFLTRLENAFSAEWSGSSHDDWKGLTGFLSFGPSWRTVDIATRPNIPNTVGGAAVFGLRRSIGAHFYLGASSEFALTTQTSGRNGTNGDWSGTELFPCTPFIGARVNGFHFTLGYPLFGKLVLLSKTAQDEEVVYRNGIFLQGSVFIETKSGLFGVQYRQGTFDTEKIGSTTTVLNPKMKVSAFSLLFTYPLF